MIRKSDLIALFERMERERWAYEWGAAREGTVDCSGAFVWAYRQLGGPAIEHSSNYIARRAVGEMQETSKARPGWAVFKWDAEDESTPQRWRDGKGDYYHVGLLGYDGMVLEAKGSKDGFVRSRLSAWDYAAPLLEVDYEGGETPMSVLYRAIINTEKTPLRVRAWPGTGTILGRVPKGREVDVLGEEEDGYQMIRYGELVGYASAEYLQIIGEQPNAPEDDVMDPGDGWPLEKTGRVVMVITDEKGNTFIPEGAIAVTMRAAED